MSAAKFTPGPWHLRQSTTTEGDSHFFIQAGTGDGYSPNGEYFSASGIMTPPTAHLIAAAPEMYRLLDDLEDVLFCYGEASWLSGLKSVLAKARGES